MAWDRDHDGKMSPGEYRDQFMWDTPSGVLWDEVLDDDSDKPSSRKSGGGGSKAGGTSKRSYSYYDIDDDDDSDRYWDKVDEWVDKAMSKIDFSKLPELEYDEEGYPKALTFDDDFRMPGPGHVSAESYVRYQLMQHRQTDIKRIYKRYRDELVERYGYDKPEKDRKGKKGSDGGARNNAVAPSESSSAQQGQGAGSASNRAKPRQGNSIYVAGTTYEGRAQLWRAAANAADKPTICLKREPDNPHDSNAIAVYVNGSHGGYLPATKAAELAPLVDSGVATLEVVDHDISYSAVNHMYYVRLWIVEHR